VPILTAPPAAHGKLLGGAVGVGRIVETTEFSEGAREIGELVADETLKVAITMLIRPVT
jgi:hypothetical protein